MQFNETKEKMQICESSSAELSREAASFFLVDVYTRISNLKSNTHMFGADLIYHHACLSAYIQNIRRLYQLRKVVQLEFQRKNIFEHYINFIRDVIESGSGIYLNDIRDMINDKEMIFITNSEVKPY